MKRLIAQKVMEALLPSLSKEQCLQKWIKVQAHAQIHPRVKMQLPLRYLFQEKASKEELLQVGSEVTRRIELDDQVIGCDISEKDNGPCLAFYVDSRAFVESTILEFQRHLKMGSCIPHLKREWSEKTVAIDFSSPNIAKPFHMGHLRSTILGAFLGNLFEFLGSRVVRINYLGDWGTQFGILQEGMYREGTKEEDFQGDPLHTLYQLYVHANQLADTDPQFAERGREWFTRMEKGDRDALQLWDVIRTLSVQEFQKIYDRLGIKFDHYDGESLYNKSWVEGILEDLRRAGLLMKDDKGREVVSVSPKGQVVLVKSDGSLVYLTRDVAAAMDRWERFHFHRMFYVIDNSQAQHITSLVEILRQKGVEWVDRCIHVSFGRLRGLSTRKGTAVFLDDILDEAKLKMKHQQALSPTTRDYTEEVADNLGITAVIINDFKQRRTKDYDFSWDRALQSTGESGIALQYAHSRLCSLEENCGVSLPNQWESLSLADLGLNPQATLLAAQLSRVDEVMEESVARLEPCIIVKYLFSLRDAVNKAFKVLQVKGEEEATAMARLALFTSARHILAQLLKILNITPLRKM
ncbi:unnamed protein product [Darwinula stevensoni]|uniref:Probable arginine--tRNA ligase, mitochondrial n=1 Tax=Darwinula stevensoni TaxID=69355 RepID=A0A7R8XL19_9CRUS|nr:unnamed protein product [Darwinula stevensoni]CAG0893753.1 unnamed protein product [Darwinula stevensoni]